MYLDAARETPASTNSARQTRSNRNKSKPTTTIDSCPRIITNPELVITDNAVDVSSHLSSPEIEVISLENSHMNLSTLNSDVSIVSQTTSTTMGQMNSNNFSSSSIIVSSSSSTVSDQRGITIIDSSNSNSSTASSSSSNSLLVKRPRKLLPSPAATPTSKPSLRSSSASGKGFFYN